jgi:two-component system nitrogen regulation response regulator NtrX
MSSQDTKSILIVDDEKDITDLITDILSDSKAGYQISVANSFENAKSLIENRNFSVALLDIWLDDQDDGIKLLELIKRKDKNTQVIMISGHGNIRIALKSVRIGAFDYLEKPFKSSKLRILVKNAIEFGKMTNILSREDRIEERYSEIIGSSDVILEAKKLIDQASRDETRVLLLGEPGTAKKNIARYIHKNSKYRDGFFNFITPHANNSRFLLPNQPEGTLYFEEIGKFSLDFQENLLEFLNESQFNSDGSGAVHQFKIITSTSQDLDELINKNQFNHDLYLRIKTAEIKIPPLRKRVSDIGALCESFINYFVDLKNLPRISLKKNAIYKLQNYEWPGNLDQLKSVIEWIMINNNQDGAEVDANKIILDAFHGKGFSLEKTFAMDLKEARDEFEKQYLSFHLKKNNFSVTKTAEDVGMDRSALHRKLKNLGVTCEDFV